MMDKDSITTDKLKYIKIHFLIIYLYSSIHIFVLVYK